LKVLDPNRPIREAEVEKRIPHVRFTPKAEIHCQKATSIRRHRAVRLDPAPQEIRPSGTSGAWGRIT
ncbi:MAG: hypothetical protein WA806_22855, partial [Bradyrhizobium sp.]